MRFLRCGNEIERTAKPWFVTIVSRSAGKFNLPDDALMLSSQSAATLISTSLVGSPIALWAARLRYGDASDHQRKAWLSIRSRT
jgi:hypothetical protein